MSRHPLTVEDLWSLPRVGDPAPSPDGSRVVVPVTTSSMETNEGASRLWLVPAEGGPPQPLTSAEASSDSPAWSPDGTRLVFLRKPGGPKGNGADGRVRFPDQPQVYLLPLAGGEPERLTDLPLGALDPQWFSNGRRIAFLAPVLADAPTPDGTAELLQRREEDPVKAMVTEDRLYRFWDHWLVDGKVLHVFVLDLDAGVLLDLTPTSTRWFGFMEPKGKFRIAPDGAEIAFEATCSEPPHDPLRWGVFRVKVPAEIRQHTKAGKTSLISRRRDGQAYRPVYSPDGRWIVYGLQRELDYYADRVRLVAYDRRTKERVVLTEAWDASAGGWTFGAAADVLVLNAEVAGRMGLFALDLAAAWRDPAASPPRELARGGWFGDPLPAGGRIFLSRSSLQKPPEVGSLAEDGTGWRWLTDFSGPALDGITLSSVDELSVNGADGDAVQVYLVFPPGIRPGGDTAGEQALRPRRNGRRPAPGPWPLVHMIHGGPHGAFGDQWHWRWNPHLFAAPGYVVALVNFHGSTGWGEDFTASIHGRWGDQPYRDVMAATDELVRRGLADPERLAATGGSYGGYLVSWIAGQTDRFACLVNHAGVSDFQTQFGSDVTRGWRRAFGGEPWDGLEAVDQYNPMRHASGFASPMLVLHGERDFRVPAGQGLQIYNVYKAKGRPARLVYFPDENHWILKPQNSRLWYREVLGWLERWLGPGEARRAKRKQGQRRMAAATNLSASAGRAGDAMGRGHGEPGQGGESAGSKR
jgi:dipeptidyl aminopeptidase/acylaminoacyl peptidase